MKKIVGIIAAFALVAGTVFADPEVAPVITNFSGDASIEWIDDLDAEKTGLKNSESASFKIKFINEGTKSTTGDGLWGELQIKAGSVENEATLGKGGTGYTTIPAPTVETAKIHFVDGDTSVVMNIKAPGFGVGGGDILLATASATAFPSKSVALTNANGFTLEVAVPMVKANIKFADNGLQKSKDKKYAFGADATITPISGLDIYGGFAYSQEKVGDKEPMAYAAKVAYTYAIDDKFSLIPSFGYAATNAKDDQEVGGALFFKWGAGADDAGFLKVAGTDAVANKVNNGISVAAKSTLKDKAGWDITVGAYDDALLAGYVAGLKLGAQYAMNTEKDGYALGLAAAYANTFDVGIGLKVSGKFSLLNTNDGKDSKSGFAYEAGVETEDVIQNTTL